MKYGEGTYDYTLDPNKSLKDYRYEQQGEIVQDSWEEQDYLRGKIWIGESTPGEGGYNPILPGQYRFPGTYGNAGLSGIETARFHTRFP